MLLPINKVNYYTVKNILACIQIKTKIQKNINHQ